MIINRFRSRYESAIATPQQKFDIKERVYEDINVSARAHIIEVGIESAFQPLLQLYLLLPVIIDGFKTQDSISEVSHFFSVNSLVKNEELYRRQFWSILSSVVALSWSFTSYQCIQKRGSLDFGSNTPGRSMLLVANFLQISSRLLVLVLYAYLFGPGQFWPMVVSVLVHILVMSVLHFLLSNEWEKKTSKFNGRVVYHCMINGICNLYIHNWVKEIKPSYNQENKRKETAFKQFLFELIFVVENLAILVTSYLSYNEYLPTGFLTGIFVAHCFGICLKCIYYYQFHIWSNVHTFSGFFNEITGSMRNIISQITSGKPQELADTTERNHNDSMTTLEFNTLDKIKRHIYASSSADRYIPEKE